MPRPDTPVTAISLESDAGDWIGSGGSYSYTKADAVIAVETMEQYFTVTIDGDESWDGTFILPTGYTELQQGSYAELTSYGSHDPAKGGIRWLGQGHSCGTVTGWLIIDKATYADDELVELEMEFEHRCGTDPANPAMRGSIDWYADDPTTPPGPVLPVPEALWQPDAGALPTSGNFAYFLSTNPYVGGERLYTEGSATFSIQSPTYNVWHPDPYLKVAVSEGLGSGWREVEVQAMNSLTEIEPGYYSDVMRFPFHNTTKGGLGVSGLGGSDCTYSDRWFVIDEVSHTEGRVTSVTLRFNCGEHYGKIRWAE